MAANFQSRLCVDGVVGLFKDFGFFDDTEKWVLARRIEVKIRSKRDFRGVRSLKDTKIGEVQLGYYNKMKLSILITSKRKKERLPFTEIIKLIVLSVNHAIDELQPGSPTKRGWIPNMMRCSGNFGDTPLTVFPEDLSAFFECLSEYLQIEFKNLRLGFFVALYEFGQSMAWRHAVSSLENLDVVNAVELVVHVARDYKRENKLLLWKREQVRNFRSGPMADFFCYFTRGHGNFVFDIADDKKNITIMNIKFYSDMFKEIHRGKNAPFRKSCILFALLGIREKGGPRVDLEGLQHHANVVSEYSKDVLSAKCNHARVEAIISLKNKKKKSMTKLLNSCRRKFTQKLGEANLWLAESSYDGFKEHLNNSVTPAVETMKDITRGEQQLRKSNPAHFIDIESYHLAMVCEMIISYFIYGKLNYWRRPEAGRYNRRMKNLLGLNGGTFRFIGDPPKAVFGGLGFTNMVTLTDGKLRYNGTYVYTEYVNKDISEEENRGRISNCLEILQGDNSDAGIRARAFEVVAEILCDEIILHAKKKRPGNDICTFMAQNPHDAIGSKKFVWWITSNKTLEHQAVSKVVGAVRYIVGNLQVLRKELEQRIELELWKSGKCLLYPSDLNWNKIHMPTWEGNSLIVMPSIGAGNYQFSTASNTIKQMVACQYQQGWHAIYKYRIPVEQIIKTLSNAEHYRETDTQSDLVQIIFRELWRNYVQVKTHVADPTAGPSTAAAGPSCVSAGTSGALGRLSAPFSSSNGSDESDSD